LGKGLRRRFLIRRVSFFDTLDPEHSTSISSVSGSVEVSCALGLADAVVDLIESGDTMKAAGLEEVQTILQSEAVFIVNRHTQYLDLAEKLVKRINGVLTAQNFVMVEYNILRSNLEKAKKIAPGKVSPTISPLDNPDWIAVKVMIPKNQSNQILDDLVIAGAKDIVVSALQNCRAE